MSEEPKNLINISAIPNSVDNALKNVTDKPTLSIGTTFADIWDLFFGGISYLSEKRKIKYAHDLEVFREQLESSIKQIPPEKAVEPSTQTTAQALENSKYCIDEENLREMFIALISNSMNADYQKYIHPSFAEILKQMSPLDAKIIRVFRNSDADGLPICQYIIDTDEGTTTLFEHAFLNYPQQDLLECSLSISSLIRLGLLENSYTSFLVTENIYNPFKEHSLFKKLQKEHPTQTVTIQKGHVWVTPLGSSFIRVCIHD